MSQTNTNTNNCQNRNQISGRGGQGQGGPSASGGGICHKGQRNNSIEKYSFEGEMKDDKFDEEEVDEIELSRRQDLYYREMNNDIVGQQK